MDTPDDLGELLLELRVTDRGDLFAVEGGLVGAIFVETTRLHLPRGTSEGATATTRSGIQKLDSKCVYKQLE